MNTLALRLKEAREERGWSQAELARRAGLKSQSLIGNLEAGLRKSSSHIPSVASALGVNALWLSGGKGQKYPLTSSLVAGYEQGVANTVMAGNLYRVPLVSWVRAGDFSEVTDHLAGDGKMVETTYRARANTFALIVSGPSMEPTFPNGCTIIVEPDAIPINGSYIIVRQNGDTEATFKQLVIEGNNKYLKALNPDWPKRIIEMLPDAVVIGVVKKMEMDV